MDTDTEAASISSMKYFTEKDKFYTLTEKGIELRDKILEWCDKERYDIACSIGRLTGRAAKHCSNIIYRALSSSGLNNPSFRDLSYIMMELVGREESQRSVFFDVKAPAARKPPGKRPQSDVDIMVSFFKTYPHQHTKPNQNLITQRAEHFKVSAEVMNLAVLKGWTRGYHSDPVSKAHETLKYLDSSRVREDAPATTDEETATMSAVISVPTFTDEDGSSTGTTAKQQTESSVPTVFNLAKRNPDGTTTTSVPDNWDDSSDSGDA
jgi:hypothetical protein